MCQGAGLAREAWRGRAAKDAYSRAPGKAARVKVGSARAYSTTARAGLMLQPRTSISRFALADRLFGWPLCGPPQGPRNQLVGRPFLIPTISQLNPVSEN